MTVMPGEQVAAPVGDLPTWSTVDPAASLTIVLIVVVASLARDAYLTRRRTAAATLALVDVALMISLMFDVRP
jgi:hypothetical protein